MPRWTGHVLLYLLYARFVTNMFTNTVGNVEGARKAIREHLIRSSETTITAADQCLDAIVAIAEALIVCFRAEKKVLICGNGGSAADSQHMAAEFVNRLGSENDRPPLPALALTTDTSFLTSYANDIGYDGVFERQVLAFGNPGDVLIAISTSGNSKNVIRAVASGRERRLTTVGLLGEGGALSSLVDHAVIVPSRDTQHVQESLLTIEHAICLTVERELFGLGSAG
jgi:D-sedoheptulose 7-phosphate isomerase